MQFRPTPQTSDIAVEEIADSPENTAMKAKELFKRVMIVAELLANCSGRPSWRIRNGYCIPATPRGTPDGFRVKESK